MPGWVIPIQLLLPARDQRVIITTVHAFDRHSAPDGCLLHWRCLGWTGLVASRRVMVWVMEMPAGFWEINHPHTS